jgi:hypothetical protein
MSDPRERAEATAREYIASAATLELLGSGIEGFVFAIWRGNAVKVFQHPSMFRPGVGRI